MRKTITKNKLKSILTIALALVLSVAAFFCVACSNDSSSTKYNSYTTKTEKDDAKLANGSFEYGVYSLDLDDFPKRYSITGWSSVSSDNSATSSTVNSGVVDVSAEGWKELINTLYTDSDFKTYVNRAYTFEGTTNDEKKQELVGTDDKAGLWATPSVHPADSDTVEGTKVLMINNYNNTWANIGSAQATTSSNTITLEKGQYGKISAWVKTKNIDVENAFNKENKIGANIRVVNTVNSKTQSVYSVYGIVAEEWTKYEIYVKADENYACTIKVALGLGFGNGTNNTADWCEGTAYFDDVVFTQYKNAEEFEAATAGKTAKTDTVDYNGEEKIYNDVRTLAVNQYYLYDMTVNTPVGYFNTNGFTMSGDYTKTSVGETSETYFGNHSSFDETTGVATLKNASYSIKIENAAFSVAPQGYVYFSFNIDNQLSDFDRNGISVYVYDVNGSATNVTNALTFKTSGEDKTCSVMVKNNFTDGDNRDFYVLVVVGPTDVTSNKIKDNYATGTVTISDLKYATGEAFRYVKDANGNATDVETENYKFYELFSGSADKTVSLYAGENADYSEDTDTDSYTFEVSSSNSGEILFHPTKVKNYTGVESDHVYLTENGTKTAIDNRTTGYEGNYAGLINTKYLDNYGSVKSIVADALNGSYVGNIQPLMIYNASGDSYGYVGKSLNIAESSFAKISVKVRVTGEAKAYLYLADTTGANKTVVTLDDFTVNTDGFKYIENGKKFSNNELALTLSASDMDNDGWKTATFYIATGSQAKELRLEMWNGSRDGSEPSVGAVFFDSVSVSTSSGFSEPDWKTAFVDSSSVLYGLDTENKALYRRELDETEIEFNNKQTDSEKLVSYDAKYIWLRTSDTVYAVFNTLPEYRVAVDPNSSSDDDNKDSGCANTDPGVFWMSFSTILLGVALAVAIIMLIVKRVRIKAKANKNDAKSHYKVTSRYNAKNDKKKTEAKVTETKAEADNSEDNSGATETETTEEAKEETEATENTETLDDYVYGDVQNFGDAEEEKTDSSESSENVENTENNDTQE